MSASEHTTTLRRPGPPANAETARFWEGLRLGEVLLQECHQCGAFQHYPRSLCRRCWSTILTWRVSSGEGMIWTWTVVYRPPHPAWNDEVPYAVLVVELIEGPRVVAAYEGDLADLVIGLPVVVSGRAERDGAVVVARPVEGGRGSASGGSS